MRAIIFLSMPQTSAGLADRHSPGIAVCLRAALSQSQGTSFVMFRTLEFCCSVCKGQRFRKTHTAREGGQEGWSQHWCRYFFSLGTVLRGLCFLCQSLGKCRTGCSSGAVDGNLCLHPSSTERSLLLVRTNPVWILSPFFILVLLILACLRETGDILKCDADVWQRLK